MPSGHKKAAIKRIRERYNKDWLVQIVPDGIELMHEVSHELTHHVFLTFVRDDVLGLRIQPSVGIRFAEVSKTRDLISPPDKYTVRGITGLVFLNSWLAREQRQNGGWFFDATLPLLPALDAFLELVDSTIQQSGFFESLPDLEAYIAAIENKTWPFFTIMPPYLYALVARGQFAKAQALARDYRAEMIRIGEERGFVKREGSTRVYDDLIRYTEQKLATVGDTT